MIEQISGTTKRYTPGFDKDIASVAGILEPELIKTGLDA